MQISAAERYHFCKIRPKIDHLKLENLLYQGFALSACQIYKCKSDVVLASHGRAALVFTYTVSSIESVKC